MYFETTTQYECRTSKTVAAIFSTRELAQKWLNQWREKNPSYAEALMIVKVTTRTEMEIVS